MLQNNSSIAVFQCRGCAFCWIKGCSATNGQITTLLRRAHLCSKPYCTVGHMNTGTEDNNDGYSVSNISNRYCTYRTFAFVRAGDLTSSKLLSKLKHNGRSNLGILSSLSPEYRPSLPCVCESVTYDTYLTWAPLGSKYVCLFTWVVIMTNYFLYRTARMVVVLPSTETNLVF